MLQIFGLSKRFGDKQIFKDINMNVSKGDIAIIKGPSGVGKTTLIRCLCGLETQDEGRIEITDTTDGKHSQVGLVFQNFNLFPHLSVMGNITLALKEVLHMNQTEAEVKAHNLIEALKLTSLENQYPFQLSGGQKQRVAIARALALEPDYLCFDEPTSALDEALRDSFGEILQELAKLGMGIIVITHDGEFAQKFASRLFEMNKSGLIELES